MNLLTKIVSIAILSVSLISNSAYAEKEKSTFEKRAVQMRQFKETDSQKIIDSVQGTLADLGFTNVFYDSESQIGEAWGDTYRITWYIRKKGETVIIRALLKYQNISEKSEASVSDKEYKNFWLALGNARFLDNIELDPKELQ